MEDKIRNVYKFIRETMIRCDNGFLGPYIKAEILLVKGDMRDIADSIKESDEYIYEELKKTQMNLFYNNNCVNLFALGKGKVLLEILMERMKGNCWKITLDFLHPEISKVSKAKVIDGYYADAVESAFKEINVRVKNIFSKRKPNENPPDGMDLMNKVFSLSNPIIKLDDLTTDSGKNVQLGYMQMFAGAMKGIRNPKAHANVTITKEEAIDSLFFASLLMYKIDQGKS